MSAKSQVKTKPAGTTLMRGNDGYQYVSGVLMDVIENARTAETASGDQLAWHHLVFATGETFEVSSNWTPRFNLYVGQELTARSQYGTRTNGTSGITYEMVEGLDQLYK